MADCMTFPETVDDFIEQYEIRDTEEVYTNGRMLISVFRVKQMLDHYFRERTCYSERSDGWECSECGFLDAYMTASFINYCPNCGARVIEDA